MSLPEWFPRDAKEATQWRQVNMAECTHKNDDRIKVWFSTHPGKVLVRIPRGCLPEVLKLIEEHLASQAKRHRRGKGAK